MKQLLLVLLCWGFVPNFTFAQTTEPTYPNVMLKCGSCTMNIHSVPASTMDSALQIATLLFNSKDFQDSLLQTELRFAFSDNDGGCNSEVTTQGSDGYVTGAEILQLLHSRNVYTIDWTVNKYKKGELGVTTLCEFNTTTHLKNVMRDCQYKLSPASAIAYNLCHEIFHSLGYKHYENKIPEEDVRWDGETFNTDHYRRDITYRIGWIAFDMLNRRVNKEYKSYPYF